MNDLDFRILGPLEVIADGQSVELGGPKQRALLAYLLLHADEYVGSEQLIDALWGERPPATAAKSVQVMVSQLRKALGEEIIVTRRKGYVLEAGPDRLDLWRFEALLDQGRRLLAGGDPAAAAERLNAALALYRGEPLAELRYEPFARDAIARLDELRVEALEERFDAELARGRHAELISELAALVREHPLRERLRAQLMLALYSSGRQAEALECYRQARAAAAELGLATGRSLRELEARILVQDASLEAPPASGTGRSPSPGEGATRSRKLIVAGGGLLLTAAVAAAAVELRRGASTSLMIGPDTVGLIDPATLQLKAAVPVSGAPARLSVADGRVWVGSDDGHAVARIDERGRTVAALSSIGVAPSDLATGEGAVWVVDRATGRLVEVGTDYAQVVRTATLRSALTAAAIPDRNALQPWSVAAGAGGVWITDGSRVLRRADPRDPGRVLSFDVGRPVNAVAVGGDAVWAVGGSTASVIQIDPRTGHVVDRIAIVARERGGSPYPIAVAVGLGSVWVLDANTAAVTRIDPEQGGVTATIPIGIERRPRALAIGDGRLWVADGDGTLARIDPATNGLATVRVAPSLVDVGVGSAGVWVTGAAGLSAATGSTVSVTDGVRPLPASMCSPIYAAPGTVPRALIVSDFPLQASIGNNTAPLTTAIQAVLRAHRFRAGGRVIGYQSCDDSNYANPYDNRARCIANANEYGSDPDVVGIIGPFQSDCARFEIPIANRAKHGPLAMISPSTTYMGLTRPGPGTAAGEPNSLYPTGTRNFVRLIPADDVQGEADALLTTQLGRRRVFVLDDRGPYGQGLAVDFADAAQKLGVTITGRAGWSNDPRHRYLSLARTIRASRADAVFLAGAESDNAGRLVRDLRAVLGDGVQFLAPDGFALPDVIDLTGAAGEGMTISIAGRPITALPPTGRRFAAALGRELGQPPEPFAVYAGEATEVMLDAIARSNGTRESITHTLFATRIRDGILGDFDVTPTGDITSRAVTIYRILHGRQVLYRVITPPTEPAHGRSG